MDSTPFFILVLGGVVGYLVGDRLARFEAVRDEEEDSSPPCDPNCEVCRLKPALALFVTDALDLHGRVLAKIHEHIITADEITENDLSGTVAHLLEHVKDDLLDADGAYVLTFMKLPKRGVLEMFKSLLARGIEHVGVEPVRAAYRALCDASENDVDARFEKLVREAWRPSPITEQ